ncbi:MAG TPA: hypothetical protein VGG87_00415 [Solirubrobacteraceae bacterium]
MLVSRRIGSCSSTVSGHTRRLGALALVLIGLFAISACGTTSSSSGDAQTLLRQTFTGPHTVRSGILNFGLALNPSGSRTITTPITLGLGGPFQSRGSGKLPASKLELTINALGHHGQLGIVSTGSNGFVTLGGTAYQLPAADYQKLASSFSSAAAGGGTGGLSKLGINPLHWLTQPTVVGSESVGGASTTHIRAHVNVDALLGDLNTFLQKASATGATGSAALPTAISPATRQKVASAVRNATVDVWTGSNDKTLRKLLVSLDFPVTGQISTELGGLSAAGISLSLAYANLNQPQTIAAPAHVRPFSGFTSRIKGLSGQLQGLFGGGTAGAASGAGTASSSSSSAAVSGYSACLQRAKGDVAKMQRCASLLNGGG